MHDSRQVPEEREDDEEAEDQRHGVLALPIHGAEHGRRPDQAQQRGRVVPAGAQRLVELEGGDHEHDHDENEDGDGSDLRCHQNGHAEKHARADSDG